MSSPLQLQAERMRRDEQVRMAINQRLIESGEKTRLKALLREKLVECGWRDSLKDHCRGACSCARGSAALELHCVGARCAAHARYCCRTPLARCRRQHAAAPSSPTSSPQHARTRRLAHCWSGSLSLTLTPLLPPPRARSRHFRRGHPKQGAAEDYSGRAGGGDYAARACDSAGRDQGQHAPTNPKVSRRGARGGKRAGGGKRCRGVCRCRHRPERCEAVAARKSVVFTM